jgi:hypothetical protein
MSFYEYWHEQQAKKAAERQVLIEQSQSWTGRRVWVSAPASVGGTQYGEVERIDEQGRVYIVVGYDHADQPRYWTSDVGLLGRSVTLAEG